MNSPKWPFSLTHQTQLILVNLAVWFFLDPQLWLCLIAFDFFETTASCKSCIVLFYKDYLHFCENTILFFFYLLQHRNLLFCSLCSMIVLIISNLLISFKRLRKCLLVQYYSKSYYSSVFMWRHDNTSKILTLNVKIFDFEVKIKDNKEHAYVMLNEYLLCIVFFIEIFFLLCAWF